MCIWEMQKKSKQFAFVTKTSLVHLFEEKYTHNIFFYVVCSFRTYDAMTLHNVLFFVAQSNICLLTITLITCSSLFSFSSSVSPVSVKLSNPCFVIICSRNFRKSLLLHLFPFSCVIYVYPMVFDVFWTNITFKADAYYTFLS